MNELIIDTMTQVEAIEWRARVGNAATSLRELLWEGYQRQVWIVLGYRNWSECIRELAREFGFSEGRLWQLHSANQTEQNLLDGRTVAEISEWQLRPLRGLVPENQRKVWQELKETTPQDKITAPIVQQAVDRFNQRTRNREVMSRSDNNEWYTPADIIECAHEVLGSIELDPASSALANETVKASRYFSIEDNGLGQHWTGRIWLNPPYGDEVGNFVFKLITSYKSGEVPEALLLVKAATDTRWFQPLFDYPICFVYRRVNFYNADGIGTATFPSACVYLGQNVLKFLKAFSSIGPICERIRDINRS